MEFINNVLNFSQMNLIRYLLLDFLLHHSWNCHFIFSEVFSEITIPPFPIKTGDWISKSLEICMFQMSRVGIPGLVYLHLFHGWNGYQSSSLGLFRRVWLLQRYVEQAWRFHRFLKVRTTITPSVNEWIESVKKIQVVWMHEYSAKYLKGAINVGTRYR